MAKKTSQGGAIPKQSVVDITDKHLRDQWQRMALRSLVYRHIPADLLALMVQQTGQNVQVLLTCASQV